MAYPDETGRKTPARAPDRERTVARAGFVMPWQQKPRTRWPGGCLRGARKASGASRSSVQNSGEPREQRVGELLTHRALLEALDQLGEEALDHEPGGEPARDAVRHQVED